MGVPIETIVREQRERRDRESVRELTHVSRHVTTLSPRHVSTPGPRQVTTSGPRYVSEPSPRHVSTPSPVHVSSLSPKHIPVSPIHNSIEDDPLRPYKDEVEAGRVELRQFLDDVSQFISDMENFHPVKQQSASKTLVRTLPPPQLSQPQRSQQLSQPQLSRQKLSLNSDDRQLSQPQRSQQLSLTSDDRQLSRQLSPVSVTTSSPVSHSVTPGYPISYTSPNAKVFLSTNYISHTPSTSLSTVSSTASPHRKQVTELLQY